MAAPPRRAAARPVMGAPRLAVEQQELALYYQARLSLATGTRTGLEAQIRWPHPRRGMVPPGTFLPLAEQTGRIPSIGAWVLQAACHEAAGWPDSAVVSVNVSSHQMAGQALLGQVASALEQSGLNPERLELAMAGTALPDLDIDMLLTLSALRDLGAGIMLNHFGTGFSNLAMLKRLPLTAVKLDHSLVRDLPGDHVDAAIVRAVIDAAHAMGLTVVAEKIESEPQRAFLSGCGCDEGEGLLFGQPAPAAESFL